MNIHLSVYGQDILWGISRGTFEISNTMFHPWGISYDFKKGVDFNRDLNARKRFWKGPPGLPYWQRAVPSWHRNAFCITGPCEGNHWRMPLTMACDAELWWFLVVGKNCWTKSRIVGDLSRIDHDDVIKWKHFPCYWPFLRGIHRWPVDSPHKGQWRGALMLSFVCAWTEPPSKQSRRRWFETPPRSSWRHCNGVISPVYIYRLINQSQRQKIKNSRPVMWKMVVAPDWSAPPQLLMAINPTSVYHGLKNICISHLTCLTTGDIDFPRLFQKYQP